MPMIDFMVVVLPAPLRPSSVTTSPGMMWKSMPCRMCDSPYQALRPLTARSGASEAASGMAGSHIGLDHLRVLRDGGVVALGKDLAARQHGDGVGEVGDHAEIVLDHQDRAVGRHLLDQRRDAVDVLVTHAGGRLV